jgi:hypothetical protein
MLVRRREQASAKQTAGFATLVETARRLSLGSLNLYQRSPLLNLIESRGTRLDYAWAHYAWEPVETPFTDEGDLVKTLKDFDRALSSDLKALATSFLDDTETGLIEMNRKFSGLGAILFT